MATLQYLPCVVSEAKPTAEAMGGWRLLARAAVLVAIRDAAGLTRLDTQEREDAADWLLSVDGICFAELAGLDPYGLRDWVMDGCKYEKEGRK